MKSLKGESEACTRSPSAPTRGGSQGEAGSETALGEVWEKIFGRRRNAARGRTVRLWRSRDGGLVQELAEHAGDVHGLAFSRDGKWMASRTVKLWSLKR